MNVQVAVGPVDATIAVAWIRHWQSALRSIAGLAGELTIHVDPGPFERLVALLDEWEATALVSTTFWWRRVVTDVELRPVVDQWLMIGELTDGDLERLGTTWAPDWMRPMTDAVVSGVSAALVALGDLGADLRRQLTGPDDG